MLVFLIKRLSQGILVMLAVAFLAATSYLPPTAGPVVDASQEHCPKSHRSSMKASWAPDDRINSL